MNSRLSLFRLMLAFFFILLMSIFLILTLLNSQNKQTTRSSAANIEGVPDPIEPSGTIVVCPTGTAGEGGCDYIGGADIQSALDNAQDGNTIVIRDGNYTDVVVDIGTRGHPEKDNLIITGESTNTVLNGGSLLSVFSVLTQTLKTITIKNLTIQPLANSAIYTGLSAKVIIANTLLLSAPVSGILVGDSSQAIITNNTINGSLSHGINCIDTSVCTIRNTISTNNGGVGISGVGKSNFENQQLTYNDSWNNTGGNYNSYWTSQELSDMHDLFVDPLYIIYPVVDRYFHVQAGSPTRDAGDPSLTDIDGSKSDMGVYGGPEGYVADADYILPAPSAFTSTCGTDNTTVSISWDPVAGANKYILRLDHFDNVDPEWFNMPYDLYIDTSSPPIGVTCTATSCTVAIVAGDTYLADSSVQAVKPYEGYPYSAPSSTFLSDFYCSDARASLTPSPLPFLTITETQDPTPTQTPPPTIPLPTLTPTSILTQSPSPTTVSGLTLTLNLKLQGVFTKPANSIQAKITLDGGDLASPSAVTGTFSPTDDKATDGGTIYTGTVTFAGIPTGTNYKVLVKGEKHIQKKICTEKPSETYAGSYSCANGAITISGNEAKTLDFSGVFLLIGDLPQQDGIVNSYDTSLIANNLGSTDPSIVTLADVNYDGVVNAADYSLMIAALAVRSDEY